MVATISHERAATVYGARARQMSGRLKSPAAYRLDEIVVVALVTATLVCVALAGCWFIL